MYRIYIIVFEIFSIIIYCNTAGHFHIYTWESEEVRWLYISSLRLLHSFIMDRREKDTIWTEREP